MEKLKVPHNGTLYFAYGSNMDEKQMEQRCRDHELVGTARLGGHRFRLNSRSVATIVPDERAAVYGVVWRISREDEASLDRYEGVAQGLYRKEQMEVKLLVGGRVNALVYVAADSEPGNRWGEYLNRIIKSAKLHDLPKMYIRELEGWTKFKRVYSEKESEYLNRLTSGGSMDRERAEWYLHNMQTWTEDDCRRYTEYHRYILGIEDEE